MLSTPADFPFLVKSLQFQPSPERSVVEGGGADFPFLVMLLQFGRSVADLLLGGGRGGGLTAVQNCTVTQPS